MTRLSSSLGAAALALVFATGCSTRPAPTAPTARVASHAAPAGLVSVRMATAVQERYSSYLLGLDGVVGDGIELDARGSACIQLYCSRAGVSAPAWLAGVPVVTEVTGELAGFSLTDKQRPVPIGVSCGNDHECLPGTLGCIVTRDGVRYALSANHVFARQNLGAIGEAIVQPSRPDGSPDCSPLGPSYEIAKLADFEPVVYDGKTPNAMDAAIARLEVGTTCATPPDCYGEPSSAPVDATVGMAIQKVGRTTGLTLGTVKAVNAKVKLTFPSGVALYTGQILTSKAFGGFGDSGSLVVTGDPGARPVGMLIGGSNVGGGVVTPIAPILARFGVTICGR